MGKNTKLGPKFAKDKALKGIYLLPNLLTTMALFAGFYSIIAAISGYYHFAAIAFFMGVALDGLDGRVARLIKSQSNFGAIYDSLSDVIVSGLTPALVAYLWALHDFGKVGWLLAFYYTAATALRLARFNSGGGSNDFFKGLPCPMAASVIMGFIWVCTTYEYHSYLTKIIVTILTFFVATLMVSNIQYYSFKNIDIRTKVSFVWSSLVLLGLIVIFLHPPVTFFLMSSIYTLSGIIYTISQRPHRNQQEQQTGPSI